MTLATLDLFIVGVIGVSALISLVRGFTSEFLSLLTWLLAILLPFYYTEQFSAFLPDTIESPSARWFISAGVLFIGAMVFCSIISFLIRKLIGTTGAGLIDRLFGSGLGAVRGLLILAVVALLATSNPSIPREKWWNESKLLPVVLIVSKIMHSQLPESVADWFKINELP
jgi:membrane protein required for colicin V production